MVEYRNNLDKNKYMKYAKLENGNVEFEPSMVQTENSVVFNPQPETLIKLGYKEYIETDKPAAKKWYNHVKKFKETKTKIIQEWEYEKLPQPDYKSIVIQKINEKYDVNDEIALSYKQDTQEFQDYRDYVQQCKAFALQEINEWLNTPAIEEAV